MYGEITTGAESDLEHVTSIARQMVGRWGMSDAIGAITVLPAGGEALPVGMGPGGASPETLALVDSEVRALVEECYDIALSTLREHRDQLNHSPMRCSSGRHWKRTRSTRSSVFGSN